MVGFCGNPPFRSPHRVLHLRPLPAFEDNYIWTLSDDGGQAIVVDPGDAAPVLAAADQGLRPVALLLTHHHADHVAENHIWKERHGVEILAHPLEAARLLDVDRTIDPGEVVEAGGLRIQPIHTPGHTDGMLSLMVGDHDLFTGDTLFKGSVGGVRAPGSTSFADLKHSIMDVIMKLPPGTDLHPGHTDPTTVGDEWESNAFIRVWRGLDEESSERCRVGDDEGTLVLWAPDYDGGHKAWVRWDDGRDDIVPGSAVTRY
jgi:hydroxyacylglutathione hydrolase